MGSYEVNKAVESEAAYLLELWVDDWDERCDPSEIHSNGSGDGNTQHISVDDEIQLSDEYLEETGMEFTLAKGEYLGSRIESMASSMLTLKAEDMARELAKEIEEAIEEFDDGTGDISVGRTDNLGWFPHVSETDSSLGTIYHYRNVEDQGNHIDLLHLDHGGIRLYVRKHLNKD